MQYPVDGYTVISPADIKKNGVGRNTKLSATDIEWIKKMYPPIGKWWKIPWLYHKNKKISKNLSILKNQN